MISTVAGMAFDSSTLGFAQSAATSPGLLAELPELFLRVVSTSGDRLELCEKTGAAMESLFDAIFLFHAEPGEDNDFALSGNLTSSKSSLPAEAQSEIQRRCAEACSNGRYQTLQFGKRGELFVATIVPVLLRGRPPEALMAIQPVALHNASVVVNALQFAAAHFTLWHVLNEASAAEREAQAAAALVELLGKLVVEPDVARASAVLAGHLKEYFHADHAAIGLLPRENAPCRLVALSGATVIDRQGDLSHCLELAMDETIARKAFSIWPPAEDSGGHALMNYKRLCLAAGSRSAIGAPLYRCNGEPLGAIVALGTDDLVRKESTRQFLSAAAEPLAQTLALMRRKERGAVARWLRRSSRQVRGRVKKIAIIAAAVIAATLCIPWPYRVGCECQIQPVVRRFAVAPYAGILEKTIAEPGDVVANGQVLARMDGRELRWELAGLQAEYDRAVKQRDAAMSARRAGAEQIAALEMQRLQQKMDLLKHRQDTLEVVSPCDGVILSGDLRQVQGAPMSIGQALYEIAPLEKMIVELEVPEDEISNVEPEQEVTMHFEAFPWQKESGAISKVHPRLEMREHRAVFIAEVPLSNMADAFRPGMRGQAQITTAAHPLAWNLFHRAWHWALFHLGW